MIYLIAFLHAIPVLIVGLGSLNRGRVIGTAVFMAAVGVVTGDAAYIAVDLVAVGLALGFCLSKNDGDGSEVRQSRHQQSVSVNSVRQQGDSGLSSGRQPTSSGRENMGFTSALKLSSIYDQRIKAYSFEPRSLPPDLHSTICSSFERRAERYADMSGMTGSSRSEYVQESIELAADLVVLCCIGPTLFTKKGGFDAAGTIAILAKDCNSKDMQTSPLSSK